MAFVVLVNISKVRGLFVMVSMLALRGRGREAAET